MDLIHELVEKLENAGWFICTDYNLISAMEDSDAGNELEMDSYCILDAEDNSGPYLLTQEKEKGIGFNISPEERVIIEEIEPLCTSWQKILENSSKLQEALAKLNELRFNMKETS